MQKQYWNTALYTGVTNNLRRRVGEHKRGSGGGFTSRYKIVKLVYYGIWPKAWLAIVREKQTKAGSRRKKIALVESTNPAWKDLVDSLA